MAETWESRHAAAKSDRFRAALLDWFDANQRELPWRKTRDPYRILVSEVMLQQTQVDRVIPYYDRFLQRFPSVQALAAAPTAEVIREWAGLGYNRRAVNLQRTAQVVVSDFAGVFPPSVAELRKLPGIGPYTAGAIACFAFEQDVAFLDTNMRRTIHRVFFGVDVLTPCPSPGDLERLAIALVPSGDGWRWNQALIEFGALQCTARRPACVVCPIQANCVAFPAIQTAIATLSNTRSERRDVPFTGSNRYYRGRIVDALRDLSAATDDGVNLPTLGARIRSDFTVAEHLPWLTGLVNDLAREGLAEFAEERAIYDWEPTESTESTEVDQGKLTVRLPR